MAQKTHLPTQSYLEQVRKAEPKVLKKMQEVFDRYFQMNKIVMDLLKTLGYPVAYITYSGTDDKYFVFNYVTEEGLLFASTKGNNSITLCYHYWGIPSERSIQASIKDSISVLNEADFSLSDCLTSSK